MIAVSCATCGEGMIINDNSLAFITPIGLVQNICSNTCLLTYNNSDFILKIAETINKNDDSGENNVRL